jgi:hypothetical protein
MTATRSDVGEEVKEDYYCAICLEEEPRQRPLKAWFKESCQHEFHTDCLMTWYRSQHSKCPLCNDKKRSYHTMLHRDVDEFLMTVIQEPTTECTPKAQLQLQRWQALVVTIQTLETQLNTLKTETVYVTHRGMIETVERTLRRARNEQQAVTQLLLREQYPSPTILVKEEHLHLLTNHSASNEEDNPPSPQAQSIIELLLEMSSDTTITQRGGITFATASYVTPASPSD